MTPEYILNGNWGLEEVELFMKAMFCRKVVYDKISDESIEFLKIWACLGKPFSDTNYDATFNDFREALQNNASSFFDDFFNRLAASGLPDEKVNILISTLTHEPVESGYQVLLMKIIGNVLNRLPFIPEGYEVVKKMKCPLYDIDYFLEKYDFLNDNTALFDKIVNEHNEASVEYSFPDVYVSEKFLRDEEKEELLIKIDPSVSHTIKSLTISFAEINTFQELLNTLFNHHLSNKVSMYSYGKQWVLAKYDGVYFTDLAKTQDSDRRSLVRSGIDKKSILRLRLLPISQ